MMSITVDVVLTHVSLTPVRHFGTRVNLKTESPRRGDNDIDIDFPFHFIRSRNECILIVNITVEFHLGRVPWAYARIFTFAIEAQKYCVI